MNDFTIYELKSLLWAIEYVRDRTNNCGDTMRALKTKIKEMIDTYCEHDDMMESVYPVIKCERCNQLVWGNYECPCGTRL